MDMIRRLDRLEMLTDALTRVVELQSETVVELRARSEQHPVLMDAAIQRAVREALATHPLPPAQKARQRAPSAVGASDGAPDSEALAAILDAWPAEAVTVAQAVARADTDPALATALETVSGLEDGKLNTRILGIWLSRNRGRVIRKRMFEGRWIDRATMLHGIARWVVRTESPIDGEPI